MLQPGMLAPEFKGTAVVNGEFKEISLSDYKNKYAILFFYPLDFTFGCPTEIIAFSYRAEEFRRKGCELIACSTDSHFSHLAWTKTSRKEGGIEGMNIPILADKSMSISRSYGVLCESSGVAFRGLFIIDGKGILSQITINDLPVGRSVDGNLRLLEAFQFTDEHCEVCPANWRPGTKTIRTTTDGSKAFFAAAGDR
ncbi:Peroxiredoxin 1 [Sparganum proliferum]